MKKWIFSAVLSGLLLVTTAFALEPGDTLWTRTYGGAQDDHAWAAQQTTDGGYIAAGITYSFGAGSCDMYLVKTDANGDTLWTRAYGGSFWDGGYSVQQTNDGGYIVAGATMSFGAGAHDVYLVKTDANGDSLWTRTYGGAAMDWGNWVEETSDGGYIIAGFTMSFGGGAFDVYLVKTDAVGDTVWTRAYGGMAPDYGDCVQETSDGNYIVAGITSSFGAGGEDVYLLKTDASGDTLWALTYGGVEADGAWSVRQTTDGGYIVAGRTESFGAGDYDFWLLKTDASGDTLWARTYGGTGWDDAYDVRQTPDDGYILAGFTDSFGAGSYDVYLLKTDASGDTLWTRTYGGGSPDFGTSIQRTQDGSYIVGGYTSSFGAGGVDAWLLKLVGEIEPDVAIEIIPDDPPVRVPQGGRFGFTGTLINNTEDPQVVDAWVMAVGPEPQGIYWGPFKEFEDLGLAPEQTRSAHFYQRVPNLAPLGFYDYIAYCGEYPSTVIDSSFFEIEVIAGPLTKAGEAGWVLTGSFLEGDFTDLPSEFTLSGNHPNPFNASTQIRYEVPATAHVKLEVYNLFGQKVATLVDGQQEAGYRSVTWEDSEAASGVYFYKLTAGDFTEVKRMTLLR